MRALTVQRTLVIPPERERFATRIQAKKAHYSKAGCRYWVFEEAALPGAFLEFFESDDPATLARAHASAPEPVLDVNRVYLEVELD